MSSIAGPPQPPSGTPSDKPTIIAIAILVYALATVLHEGVGHGGACLLTGGRPLELSSVHFACDSEGGWVTAGGTIANLAAGCLSLLALRATPARAAHLRYALWLSMAVNLMQGCGYFLFSGVANIGDWAALICDLRPAWIYRTALAGSGALSYFCVVILAARRLRPFIPAQADAARRAGRALTLWPYLAGGVLSCVSGMFNPVGMILVAISAAAASFGGTSGLAWMPDVLGSRWAPLTGHGAIAATTPPLARRWSLIVAAAVVALLYVAVLGPGIRLG